MSKKIRNGFNYLLKKLVILVMVFLLLFGGYSAYRSRVTPTNKPTVEQNIKNHESRIVKNIRTVEDVQKIEVALDVDLQEQLLKMQKTHSTQFVTGIEEIGEILLNEYTGVFNINHIKNEKNGWWDVFNNSSVVMNGTYKAYSTIKLSSSNMHINEMGVLNINVNPADIQIKGIETKGTQGSLYKSIFGKSYTIEELQGLKNIEVENIRNKIESNTNYRENDLNVLMNIITDLANTFGVECISFNNSDPIIMDSALNFKKMELPKEAKDNLPLGIQNIEYIVVHSTANPNAGAMAHYKWYNNDISAETVHFVVDDKEVIQCLPFSIQGHGVGINKYWESGKQKVFNNNSISIEICENGDIDDAIARAEKFIKEVLIPQFPNAKIVSHQQSNGKYCPSIILNKEGGWNSFINRINSK